MIRSRWSFHHCWVDSAARRLHFVDKQLFGRPARIALHFGCDFTFSDSPQEIKIPQKEPAFMRSNHLVDVSPPVFTARTLLFFAPIVILIIRNSSRMKKKRVNFVFLFTFCLFYALTFAPTQSNGINSVRISRVASWVLRRQWRARASHSHFNCFLKSLFITSVSWFSSCTRSSNRIVCDFWRVPEQREWERGSHHVRRKLIGEIERTTK